MITKAFASILITFSVFLGAQLSKAYPSFLSATAGSSDARTTEPASSMGDENRATLLALTLDSAFRHSLWPLSAGNESGLPSVPPQHLPESKNVPPPDVSAIAVLSATESGEILCEKNSGKELPIASLTKLLTALVVIDHLDPKSITTISKNAVETYGIMGDLVVNENISVEGLLTLMLVGSSNDAAVALAEETQRRSGVNFVDLMNNKARKLEMNNSSFVDPAGLGQDNISNASDLVGLVVAVLKNPLVAKIIKIQEADVFSDNQKIRHHIRSTNKLFNRVEGVVGGKTGYTQEAGECMILITESTKAKGHLIYVILGSKIGLRFTETKKVVDWVEQIYEL